MNAAEKKRALPLIVKIAVKKGAITKDQLKRALSIFDEEQKEGKDTSLPEILVKTGMISSDTMIKLHGLAERYSEKQVTQPEIEPEPSPESQPVSEPEPEPEVIEKTESVTSLAIDGHRIDVSEDRMTAHFILSPDHSPDISPKDILNMARKKGLSHGLVRESSIQNHLKNGEKNSPILIARGTPSHPGKAPVVAYHFDSQCYRKPHGGPTDFETLSNMPSSEVHDGDLLAEKTPLVPSDSGVDIFGRTIETPAIHDITIRNGQGAEMFDDQLKIFSTIKGLPFLSVEGVIHVFPLVSLTKDYGISTGRVERDSCLKTSGTITGEYPVKGGNIIAEEIRGAEIDVVGSVVVRVGITGARIKAQGDIRARSIRGCTIETYGSVYVENEIMDSTIYACGQCVSEKSKIITSTICATCGVRSAGIGTATSVPCSITVGDLTPIRRILDDLDQRIQDNTERIAKLRKTYESLSEELKKNQAQLPPLVTFHKKAEQALQIAEARIEELKQKKLRKRLVTELATFNELKAKDQSALQAIRTASERMKEIQNEIGAIPEDMQGLESANEHLKLDRTAIVSWAKTISPTALVEVNGDLVSGTVIEGPNATLIVTDTVNSVMVREAPDPSDPNERQMMIKKFPGK